jgi:(1->4)-alpha-D-glucan 1-alpha-D-glucosylmutase
MQKATREAKRMTSWINPNEQFDHALQQFLEKITSFDLSLSDLESFVKPLVEPGRISSLAQTLLKMTVPGVPDLYQGTELWDLSLVDPDNRRPVDYDLRSQLLSELPRLSVQEIWSRQDEGLPKLWLIHQCLRVRREHRNAFSAASSYKPINAEGEKASHIVAFLRGNSVAALAQRLPLTVSRKWGGTSIKLPRGRWRNVLANEPVSGGSVRVGDLLAAFPVALLVRQNEQ